MPQIEGSHADIVNVKIIEAYPGRVVTKGGEEYVVKIKGETENGEHGTATVWLDGICEKGLDSNKGRTNLAVAMDDFKKLGMESEDPYDVEQIVGAETAFYVSVKTDGEITRYNYYLQVSSDYRPTREEFAAHIAEIRGNTQALQGEPIEGAKKLAF